MERTSETGTASETPESLFLRHLETIERAIRQACRRGGLREDDADDFASYVHLKLIEKDYAVIRKYEQRSTFAAFIAIVVQRLLLDYRIAQWGKWHASTEAKRLGDLAITIEAMLYRDGRTLEEVLPVLLRRWPTLTREAIEDVVRRLPSRTPRVRTVELDDGTADTLPADDQTGEESERAAVAELIATIIRRAIGELDPHDRLIFRLRFEGGMSVADISRTLKVEQKPLYRRLQRALAGIRARLDAAGMTASDAEAVLGSRDTDLDFGFTAADDDGRRAPRDEDGR